MSGSIIPSLVSLPQSPFPPLAVGFMGLGTGYLIYGTQELFGYPARDDRVDFATGMWGIWMPGFMQFIAGAYLFLGLTLFGTFRTPALYMAALAFTSYGVHWFAIGWNRLRGTDPRVNVGMTIAFLLISILGVIVFFKVGEDRQSAFQDKLRSLHPYDVPEIIFLAVGSGLPEYLRWVSENCRQVP